MNAKCNYKITYGLFANDKLVSDTGHNLSSAGLQLDSKIPRLVLLGSLKQIINPSLGPQLAL